MTSGPPPICMFCKNLDTDNDESLTCRAFPEGIPFDIIINTLDHRKKIASDNGVRFEPKNNSAKQYAVSVFD